MDANFLAKALYNLPSLKAKYREIIFEMGSNQFMNINSPGMKEFFTHTSNVKAQLRQGAFYAVIGSWLILLFPWLINLLDIILSHRPSQYQFIWSSFHAAAQNFSCYTVIGYSYWLVIKNCDKTVTLLFFLVAWLTLLIVTAMTSKHNYGTAIYATSAGLFAFPIIHSVLSLVFIFSLFIIAVIKFGFV